MAKPDITFPFRRAIAAILKIDPDRVSIEGEGEHPDFRMVWRIDGKKPSREQMDQVFLAQFEEPP